MDVAALRRASRTSTSHPATARVASDALDSSTIDVNVVLSADEIELLRLRFVSHCHQSTTATHKPKFLSSLQAIRLFRDDYPGLSEWEIQDLLRKCDVNLDGHLSLFEYLQARASHRLAVEASTENEVFRSFTILDTDGDGIILADDVLALVEQSGLRATGVLKQAITQAAAATTHAKQQQHRRHAGEITFDHFAHTIRAANRAMEHEIATKSLRVIQLQDELAQLDGALAAGSVLSPQKRLREKREVLVIEIDVLQNAIVCARRELLTDAHNPLGQVCETLVATYENEQHVYECLRNFIAFCSLGDATRFRYKLEKSGKAVHVLDSVLLAPPAHIQRTKAFARMMDLSLTAPSTTKPLVASAAASARYHSTLDTVSTSTAAAAAAGSSSSATAEAPPRHCAAPAALSDLLLLNPTLRRQFAFYTTAANVTNLETMTRSSFVKFVRDCELQTLTTPVLTEADLVTVFATACGTSKLMTFQQWVAATQLVLERAFPTQCTTAEALEALVKTHVVARAKCIQTQNLAPDVSLPHVMKLLREHIWQFKHIFAHFGIQSLVEVDSKVTVDMHELLCFARAFGILRTTETRDGEPYTAPPMTASAAIQPISLMELVREFFAAKLDVSFANPARRDAPDLTFREFLRCALRIALAMHAHDPARAAATRANGIVSTKFEALKDDEHRAGERSYTPLHHRRQNVLGSLPTKTCKMTSTSIISRLLRTSRALINNQQRETSASAPSSVHEDCSSNLVAPMLERTATTLLGSPPRSPIRILYGPPSSPERRTTAVATQSPPTQFVPTRPSTTHRARTRPVTSGGPPVIRVLRPPDV